MNIVDSGSDTFGVYYVPIVSAAGEPETEAGFSASTDDQAFQPLRLMVFLEPLLGSPGDRTLAGEEELLHAVDFAPRVHEKVYVLGHDDVRPK